MVTHPRTPDSGGFPLESPQKCQIFFTTSYETIFIFPTMSNNYPVGMPLALYPLPRLPLSGGKGIEGRVLFKFFKTAEALRSVTWRRKSRRPTSALPRRKARRSFPMAGRVLRSSYHDGTSRSGRGNAGNRDDRNRIALRYSLNVSDDLLWLSARGRCFPDARRGMGP